MKKRLKKYFIPNKENNHKPELLTGRGAAIVAFIGVLALGFSVLHTSFLRSSFEYLAAVAPSVIVNLTNTNREYSDVGTLQSNELLNKAAQLKANHLAENQYFSHTSPGGISPWQWFNEVGYRFKYAGENLAVNFVDSTDVERAWMNSPSHRANILNDNFTEIGVATAEGIYQGRSTIFVVQLFGAPAVPTQIPQQIIQLQSEVKIDERSEVAPATFEEIDLEDVDIFVSVEDIAVVKSAGVSSENVPNKKVSLSDRLMSQPSFAITILYYLLGILVAVVLLLSIVIEVKKQHTKSILYGILLIFLVLAFLYAGGALRAGDLIIV